MPEEEQDWSHSSSLAGEAVIKSISFLTEKLDSNSATCSALGRLRLSFLICKWANSPYLAVVRRRDSISAKACSLACWWASESWQEATEMSCLQRCGQS